MDRWILLVALEWQSVVGMFQTGCIMRHNALIVAIGNQKMAGPLNLNFLVFARWVALLHSADGRP